MKKKAGTKSTAKAKKSKPAAKAKKKAAKPAARAKAKSKSAAKPKAHAKAKPKASEHGLTVIDLFRMKQEREQQAQDPEAWKHKKDLPAQDTHGPEDAKGPNAKKSGFGGVRHH